MLVRVAILIIAPIRKDVNFCTARVGSNNVESRKVNCIYRPTCIKPSCPTSESARSFDVLVNVLQPVQQR